MHKFTFLIATFICSISFTQTELTTDQLLNDVTILSHDSLEGREIGTKGEMIAASYIETRFEQIGLKKGNTDSYYQLFSKKQQLHPHDTEFLGKEISGRNIIGLIDNNAETSIIIGAHYDHLGWGAEGSLYSGEPAIHNGADDNASGVAALLYLAEKLGKEKHTHNFIFIAFTGEERGLLGSNYFVNNATVDLSKVSFMINMDMVGRLDEDRRLAIYGVGTSPTFTSSINSIDEPLFKFKLDSSGFGPSDHTSFYLNDIPVLHFFTGQHSEYHKPTDDLELINFEGLNDVSIFIYKLIMKLDSEDKLIFTKTKDEQTTRKSFNVTLGIIPDYLYSEKGLRIDGVKENRPADNAGILKGDIIISMKDLVINTIDDYMHALNEFKEGERIDVKVIRKGNVVKLSVEF